MPLLATNLQSKQNKEATDNLKQNYGRRLAECKPVKPQVLLCPPPPNNLRGGGGGNIPFGPPNNPPTFSFNFYVKQEKSQMYQVEVKKIIIVTLI